MMSDRIAWAILAAVVVASYAYVWARLDGAPPMEAYGPTTAHGYVHAE